jgi:choice-of-anchor C domain-containing protein
MIKNLLAIAVSFPIITASSLFSASANAVSITNGSFEISAPTPGSPNDFLQINSPNNNTAISGWNISGGSIDLIGTFWTASNGNRSIDLSGTEAGTLSTTLTVLAGDVGIPTNILFDLATNGAGTKGVRVSLTGFTDQVYNVNNGTPIDANDWVLRTFSFTPTSAAPLTLTFTSLESSAQGAALDNVRIQAVPFEFSPISGLVLLGLGFGASKLAKKSAKQ